MGETERDFEGFEILVDGRFYCKLGPELSSMYAYLPQQHCMYTPPCLRWSFSGIDSLEQLF